MRSLLVGVALLIGAPGVVTAQESRVVEGCLATVSAFAGGPPDQVHSIEDFSELEPPRARVRFNIGSRSSRATCTFENRESPLVLTEACFEITCFRPDDKYTRLRFDELKLLLEQAGY